MQHGVASINAQVDVVKFFSDHAFQDLQDAHGMVHPILQVDAVRFLLTFRNQLTKEQLLSVLPVLVKHLTSDTYVAYTYAAVTIDRILFTKKGRSCCTGTPEKVAENDHLMKRTLSLLSLWVTRDSTWTRRYARDRHGTSDVDVLQRLVAILGIISENPSSPSFDQ
ncbi:Cse1-domain-containing protein [Boletus edulis BED1]|uniref:Cse1-domain-containing protein n=1 Tax=Boletus edulis BED1 TaxID=1328754 RepID=A0AAD4BFY8_BOLED|nr:Cse1-domain-containing protein [Boletus edulis BED1]